MLEIIITVIILLMLVVFVAFFAGSETAFLSLNRIRIRTLINKKVKYARLVAILKSDIDSLLSLILIGTNFCSSLAAAMLTTLIVKVLGDGGGIFSTIIVTFFVTTFGQIIPKAVALRASEKVALHNVKRLSILLKILKPVVIIFALISKAASKLSTLIFAVNTTDIITSDDLKVLISLSAAEGSIKGSQQKILNKVFRFADLTIENIMTHRVLIKSVDITDDSQTVVNEFFRTGKKVLAVMDRHSLEKIPCPIGTLYYKDVLFSINPSVNNNRNTLNNIYSDLHGENQTFEDIKLEVTNRGQKALKNTGEQQATGGTQQKNIKTLPNNKEEVTGGEFLTKDCWSVKSVMQEALFVPETLTLPECLSIFKKNDKKIAFALDEEGCFSGVVTRDDILKVIFGRVTDDPTGDPMEKLHLVSPNEFIIAGELHLSDLSDILKLPIDSDVVDTVGGFVLTGLGHLPVTGEVFRVKNNGMTLAFIVDGVAQRRITSVRLKIIT